MGQTESNLKGSTTFAYSFLNNPPINTTITEEEEELLDNTDRILKNPEIYGLKKSSYFSFLPPSSSLTITNKHRDSGYVSPCYDDENLQLVNDLNYIDQTYYYYHYYYRYKATTTTKTTQQITNDQNNQDGGVHISFTDIMLSSPDTTLRGVYLSSRSIHRLSPNIGMLTMIRKLDLSNNYLTELPESIGYMSCLETLFINKNRLNSLPDTIGYLLNLQELDASFNEIQQLTPCISYLNKLKTLSLAFNQISYLPTDINRLVRLILLDLTRNPLDVLPAEISQLPFLRRLRLDGCSFKSDLVYSLKHNPPSLVEICARIVTRKNMPMKSLPVHMVNYIQSAKSCTSCHGPYYESFVLRGRLMEKTDMHIPLEYTLCSAHWSDANDRILNMFSAQPSTFSQVIHQPYQPSLPSLSCCSPVIDNRRLSSTITTTTTRKIQQQQSPIETMDDVGNNQLVPAASVNKTTKKFLLLNRNKPILLVKNLTSRLKKSSVKKS